MPAREYMIEFRRLRGVDLQTMAKVCRVSRTLLAMLESSDQEVTHPELAEYIGLKYQLTEEQIEGMKPENHRKGSPRYNPDKYRSYHDIWDKNQQKIIRGDEIST